MAAFVDKENIAPAYDPYEYVNRVRSSERLGGACHLQPTADTACDDV